VCECVSVCEREREKGKRERQKCHFKMYPPKYGRDDSLERGRRVLTKIV